MGCGRQQSVRRVECDSFSHANASGKLLCSPSCPTRTPGPTASCPFLEFPVTGPHSVLLRVPDVRGDVSVGAPGSLPGSSALPRHRCLSLPLSGTHAPPPSPRGQRSLFLMFPRTSFGLSGFVSRLLSFRVPLSPAPSSLPRFCFAGARVTAGSRAWSPARPGAPVLRAAASFRSAVSAETSLWRCHLADPMRVSPM